MTLHWLFMLRLARAVIQQFFGGRMHKISAKFKVWSKYISNHTLGIYTLKTPSLRLGV